VIRSCRRTKAGAGPRHLTIHPNGKFAYLITETTATIGTFAVDPASGTLKELQFVVTNEYKEQPAASDIRFQALPQGGRHRSTSV
jgi:6-phosphogluconolactonase